MMIYRKESGYTATPELSPEEQEALKGLREGERVLKMIQEVQKTEHMALPAVSWQRVEAVVRNYLTLRFGFHYHLCSLGFMQEVLDGKAVYQHPDGSQVRRIRIYE